MALYRMPQDTCPVCLGAAYLAQDCLRLGKPSADEEMPRSSPRGQSWTVDGCAVDDSAFGHLRRRHVPFSPLVSGLGARTSTNPFAQPRLFFLFAGQALNHRILLSTPTTPAPSNDMQMDMYNISKLPAMSSLRIIFAECWGVSRRRKTETANRKAGLLVGTWAAAGSCDWRYFDLPSDGRIAQDVGARVGAFLFAPSGPSTTHPFLLPALHFLSPPFSRCRCLVVRLRDL